ncbi:MULTISPECIES: hypothetical protein [Cyanobium]|uniref:Uncharacterized protein n=1 Tax=Cyanobium usitatum str. Tous TaxID=2116684 RepID=A0A2P7MWW0_9CYAN|nr:MULTISPECIES: hypothetical protein [Cyanobium]MCP9780954.1 hypothetical protein [Cyanobium sp. To12R1]PSJ05720.1 hypothetical protein C7K55_06705 [Cyanobium usitatum str. Tous]
MGQRPCCRSCRHCAPPSGAEFGWCQLRQLPIHPELALELWCHHWTARPPRLPAINAAAAAGGTPAPAQPNQQLSLESAFGKS